MNVLHILHIVVGIGACSMTALVIWFLWAHWQDMGGRPVVAPLWRWLRRDPWRGDNVEHFIPNWMRLSLYPDFIIGGGWRPYLKRWYLLPRAPWPVWPIGMYLHQILRSDDDRALHNHPWPNISILLRGSYVEVVPKRSRGFREWMTPHVEKRHLLRCTGDIVLRRSGAAHRLVIPAGRPAWSLFIVGPRIRDWGFWCKKGFVHWRDFVATGDRGSVGRGCD